MFLLSKSRVKLPEVLARAFGIHSFFALDFAFLPHTCMSLLLGFDPLEFGETTLFFLSLPLLMIAVVAIQYIWAKTSKHYGPKLVNHFNSKHDEKNDSWRLLSFILSIVSNNGEFLTEKNIETSLHHGIHSVLQGLFAMWPVLAMKSFDLLNCDYLQDDPNGASFLIANPDWTCFEGKHRRVFPSALFFTSLYVVAIPWFMISIVM
jgi:hypothetical protein